MDNVESPDAAKRVQYVLMKQHSETASLLLHDLTLISSLEEQGGIGPKPPLIAGTDIPDIVAPTFLHRLYIVTFYSAVDALTYDMRNGVNLFGKSAGVELTAKERAKLVERCYDPELDRVTDEVKKNSAKVNFRLAFEYFPRIYGVNFEVRTQHPGWNDFLELLKGRHKITHPKTLEGLLGIQGLQNLDRGRVWFQNEYKRLIQECMKQIGAPMDSEEVGLPERPKVPKLDLSDDLYRTEIPQVRLSSLNFFTEMTLSLMRDCDRALALVPEGWFKNSEAPEAQFACRSVVRAMFWSLEGITYAIRYFLEGCQARGELKLWPQDLRHLNDTKQDLCTQYLRACQVFNRQLGRKCSLRTNNSEWKALKRCLRFRDEVTHPKCPAHLGIDLEKWNLLLEGLSWLSKSTGALIISEQKYQFHSGNL